MALQIDNPRQFFRTPRQAEVFEEVTVPSSTMLTSTVSEESLARDTQRHTDFDVVNLKLFSKSILRLWKQGPLNLQVYKTRFDINYERSRRLIGHTTRFNLSSYSELLFPSSN